MLVLINLPTLKIWRVSSNWPSNLVYECPVQCRSFVNDVATVKLDVLCQEI
jgi:hypothetical protein